jgi:hypothetical protein
VSDFRDPQYGPPQGYGPPPYGAPMPWRPPAATWPYGPARPGMATAAAVLGYVTAGLTIVFSVILLFVALGGDGDDTVAVLLLGVPCAVGLLVGAGQTLRRRSAHVLFVSAVAAVAVLLLALVVGVAVLAADDLIGETMFVVLALPLPLLTAIFARTTTVTAWLAAGN